VADTVIHRKVGPVLTINFSIPIAYHFLSQQTQRSQHLFV